jgi:hypothetical protein
MASQSDRRKTHATQTHTTAGEHMYGKKINRHRWITAKRVTDGFGCIKLQNTIFHGPREVVPLRARETKRFKAKVNGIHAPNI